MYCLKKLKINVKEAEDGPFFKKRPCIFSLHKKIRKRSEEENTIGAQLPQQLSKNSKLTTGERGRETEVKNEALNFSWKNK